MEKFSITINNEPVLAYKGETILEAARRSGHYIPTLCFLPKLMPISSCRLCVVEVEGRDGLILSCQTPVSEGISVKTTTEQLEGYRNEIMKFYCVNHPLECGVCDKSGECLLQNYTLFQDVDEQTFSAKEHKRDLKEWDFIRYDESLCVLCERCVHTCNELIGDDAIKIEYGGYSSKIVSTNKEGLDCSFCGECVEVCPVGALTSSAFGYKANAWELERIDSSCAHCSSACYIEYEVKNNSTEQSVYRASSDVDFSTLCGAGRFGFDFENRVEERDSNEFLNTIKAFKKADTISFGSFITNEEALILQRLKEKYGYKLINNDALNFQNFLSKFSKASGRSLYSGNLEGLRRSSVILQVGSRTHDDNPNVRYEINRAVKSNGAKFIDMHPIEDTRIDKTLFVKYEAGSEEALLSLLALKLIKDSEGLQSFFSSLDLGYLYAEANISEAEIDRVISLSSSKSPLPKTLVLGSDLYSHPRAANIAKLAGLIDARSEFSVILIPSQTNTLGVSLICDLDSTKGEFVIGYNSEGDYKLSSLSSASKDLDMPSLNQQEGTFTNINKKVVPINPALPYKGYELNDIAKALGLTNKNTIEYTKELPTDKGFKNIEFDSLNNRFLNDGSEDRGYELSIEDVDSHIDIESPKELEEYNGTIVYLSNPTLQFSMFTNECRQLGGRYDCLMVSEQFLSAAGLKGECKVSIEFDSYRFEKPLLIDEKLKGTVALMPYFNEYDTGFGYKYKRAKITKITAGGDE